MGGSPAEIVENFANVLWPCALPLAPGACPRGIEHRDELSVLISAVTAVKAPESVDYADCLPALPVVFDRLRSMVEYQVAIGDPSCATACDYFIQFRGQRDASGFAVLRVFPWNADRVPIQVAPAELENFSGASTCLIGKTGDIRHVWGQTGEDGLGLIFCELSLTHIFRFV
jgi:hypothetical protein